MTDSDYRPLNGSSISREDASSEATAAYHTTTTSIELSAKTSRMVIMIVTIAVLVICNLSNVDNSVATTLSNLNAMSSTSITSATDGTTIARIEAATPTSTIDMSTEDREQQHIHWTVMTTINRGYLEMFHNWYWWYERLNLNLPLLLVAEDDVVHEELVGWKAKQNTAAAAFNNITVERSNLHIPNAGSNETFGWGDLKYKQMMSARPRLIREKLEQGHNLIFTDVDTIWQHNPLPYFVNATTKDTTENNHYHLFSSMDPRDQRCGGFWAMVSCHETIEFVKNWEHRLLQRPGHNQGPYNHALKELQLKDYPLPKERFANGRIFENRLSRKKRKRDATIVIHFNKWTGVEGKKEAMIQYGYWRIDSNENTVVSDGG